jgi:hypothetical protein
MQVKKYIKKGMACQGLFIITQSILAFGSTNVLGFETNALFDKELLPVSTTTRGADCERIIFLNKRPELGWKF